MLLALRLYPLAVTDLRRYGCSGTITREESIGKQLKSLELREEPNSSPLDSYGVKPLTDSLLHTAGVAGCQGVQMHSESRSGEACRFRTLAHLRQRSVRRYCPCHGRALLSDVLVLPPPPPPLLLLLPIEKSRLKPCRGNQREKDVFFVIHELCSAANYGCICRQDIHYDVCRHRTLEVLGRPPLSKHYYLFLSIATV